MSRLSTMRAVLAAAGLLGFTVAGGAGAQEAFSIDANALTTAGCFGQPACVLDQATVSTGSGGLLAKKVLNGATGFGVSGGPAGSEIDIGEKVRVEFADARAIVGIEILE